MTIKMIEKIVKEIASHPEIRAYELCDKFGINRGDLVKYFSVIKGYNHAYNEMLLLNNRFVTESCSFVSSDADEIERILKGERKFPFILEFHPGPFCTSKCEFCFSRDDEYECESGKKTLSLEKFESVLKECAINDVREIWFSGGKEPFTNKDTIYFIDLANVMKFNTRVYTNGVLIKESYLDRLLYCDQIRISINAATSKTYAKVAATNKIIFEEVWNMIKELTRLKAYKKTNTKICVSFLIQNDNYNEMMDFYYMAASFGVDSVQFRIDSVGRCEKLTSEVIDKIIDYSTYIISYREKYSSEFKYPLLDLRGIGENEFDGELLPDLRKPYKCMAGLIKRGINPWGVVYNCEFASHPHFKNSSEHLVLGNVNNNSFEEIVSNARCFYPVCDFCQAHEYGMNVLLEKLKDDLDFGISVKDQIYNRKINGK